MGFSQYMTTNMLPSTSSLLSLYASFSTFMMLMRNIYSELVPKKLESFVIENLGRFFSRKKLLSYSTFIVDDSWEGYSTNELVDAVRLYLSSKIGHKNKTVRVGKFYRQKDVVAALVSGEKVVDTFQGVEVTWEFVRQEKGNHCSDVEDETFFELTFEQRHRHLVFDVYLKHILEFYEKLTAEEKVLQIYTRPHGSWQSMNFTHPSTFETLAMEHDKKKAILDDLNRFLSRKEFYQRVGKAWKRGYLLHGPPGTGKSSLIAAMANYLNYDVYDLELDSVRSDSDLRSALFSTHAKSIIIVEDIDCNSEVHNRSSDGHGDNDDSSGSSSSSSSEYSRFSLSGLLNCIDGLWSSCGEERIIVFTSNHKDVLDPALLRPGRMDMHIHMSYCSFEAFRVLASNYLGIHEHRMYDEIEGLIGSVEVTPASLAEELMKSDDVEVALGEVVKCLKRKTLENTNNALVVEEESEKS